MKTNYPSFIALETQLYVSSLNEEQRRQFYQDCFFIHYIRGVNHFEIDEDATFDLPPVISSSELVYFSLAYLNMFATEEEKLLFQKSLYKYFSQVEQSKQKEYEAHYCYQYCVRHHWKNEDIKRFTTSTGFHSATTILNKVKKYVLEHDGEFVWKEIERQRNQKFLEERLENPIYRDFIYLEKTDEGEIQFDLLNSTPAKLKKGMLGFTSTFHRDTTSTQLKQLYMMLERKIELYVAYLNSQKNERKHIQKIQTMAEATSYDRSHILPEAVAYITKYIESDCSSKEQFCEIFDLSMDSFHFYREVVEKYVPELFQQYEIRAQQNSAIGYYKFKKRLYLLIHYLKAGMEDNGTIREFDLLDYYLFFQWDFKQLAESAKSILSIAEEQILKIFIKKNERQTFINIQKELEEKRVVMQNGAPYTVTLADKQAAIDFLKNHNLPLYQALYNKVLRRKILEISKINPEKGNSK